MFNPDKYRGSNYVYSSIETSEDYLESNTKQYNEVAISTLSLNSRLTLSVLLWSVILISVTVITSVTISSPLAVHVTLSGDEAVSNLSKPNFVFVLIDDLGGGDLDSLSYASPFMTKLSGKGIKLSTYYTQEVCTPARASLMTGRYPISVGMQYGVLTAIQNWGMDSGETLLPEVMRDYGGYTTYMLGKWNLGHSSPDYLPTARGFDYFVGYMDAENNYWSKSYPTNNVFTDFMYADTECYHSYNGSDSEMYSSVFYRNKAVAAITAHDYSASPLFMYFASQAVHEPFMDAVQYPSGTDSTYYDLATWTGGAADTGLSSEAFQQILAYGNDSTTFNRRAYTVALALLDQAVGGIYDALERVGQLDNTYIIVTSDNGGCYQAGAMNGDLRGTKGSLFEGGTKVDAFVYSPLLTAPAGSTYSGLMHVSDWFPTILGFAGITSFKPATGYSLDGLDQSAAIAAADSTTCPRDFMLYNAYINVADKGFNMRTNGSVAVRNERYKLMHGYTGNPSSIWYTGDLLADDDADDGAGGTSCGQTQAMEGAFEFFLFDLQEDPYERNNLYGDKDLTSLQTELYEALNKLVARKAVLPFTTDTTVTAKFVKTVWESNGRFIQPWLAGDGRPGRPALCSKSDSVFSPVYR